MTRLLPRIRAEQILRLAKTNEAESTRVTRDFGYSPREFDQGMDDGAALLGLPARFRPNRCR